MKNALVICLIVFLSFNSTLQAQQDTTQTGSLTSGTISSQFDHLNKISNNWQEFKVIKRTNLDKVRANVMDSLQVFKNELLEVNQKLKDQNAKIQALEAEVNTTQEELKTAENARDSFSFLGMPIHKTAYNGMMWTIVAGLTAAFLFFMFKYSQSYKVISRAQKDLAETVEEFEQHRKNTLERERKLKRELVDALNGKSV